MTREEQLSCLTDRPCYVCKHRTENGCNRWVCVFEETPTERIGHWVEIDDEPHEVWECDNCGFVIDGSGCIDPYDYRDTYKFCPNCGARMDG